MMMEMGKQLPLFLSLSLLLFSFPPDYLAFFSFVVLVFGCSGGGEKRCTGVWGGIG